MKSRRQLAFEVMYTLWPDMRVADREFMTPQVATYIFIVFARAYQANRLIQGMYGLLNIAIEVTTFEQLPDYLMDQIKAGLDANWDEHGLAVTGIIEWHRQYVQSALEFGPEIAPLSLSDAIPH